MTDWAPGLMGVSNVISTNTSASSPTSRIRPEAARLAAEAPVLSESKRRSAPSKRLQPPAGGGSLHLTQGNPKAAQDAKEKAAKSGGAKKGGKSNVTYQEMITRAIVDMNDRHGSSAMAITKWIGQQFPNFDVKRTQVSKKITALVKSGYLTRVKSSFKLSAGTKDAMRKAKEQKRKGKDKGKGPKLKSTMDSSLERRSRVLKYLGMLPLVSNAWAYEETTLPLPAAAYEPVPKDMLPRPPPRSRSISRSQSPGKSPKLKRVGVEGGQGQGASASGGGGVSSSASSSSSGGGAGRPRPSSLLTRNGDVRIPRSKSALNYFQDSVRASYRRAHPGIGMPELRQRMMDEWLRLNALEKRPFFEMVEREQARLRRVVLMQQGLLEDGDDGGGHTMLPPSTADRVVPLDGQTLPPKEHVPPKAHYRSAEAQTFHAIGDSQGTSYHPRHTGWYPPGTQARYPS